MASSSPALAEALAASGRMSVYEQFHERARHAPDAIALRSARRCDTYAALDARVRRAAAMLQARGLARGDRVALLSENCCEYIEIELAAALLGLIVACQNWRLARDELRHCIALVEPGLVIASARFRAAYDATGLDVPAMTIETDYAQALAASAPLAGRPVVDPEDGLVILYTSGTTGLPKGALISHRAQIARAAVLCMDYGITREDGFVAWAPMFHMASTDQMLQALMSGATVHVIDGYEPRALVDIMSRFRIGWMVLMPGSIEPVVEILRAERPAIAGIRVIGSMIDLVPLDLAAELSSLTGAPYMNSFGSTETGLPPASGCLIAPGVVPERLSKRASSLVQFRLLDEADRDVPDGEPGEMAVRGPTVFSGYWNAPEANAKSFVGGWFHMGDMFVRNADGSYDFVDRSKYMIKSGGENIYPAEIERVMLADARVRDAVIVRKKDARWGEVPVAFVARKTEDLDAAAIESLCRAALAGYKRPKAVHFIDYDDFPRSTTGKIQRHEIERWLSERPEYRDPTGSA